LAVTLATVGALACQDAAPQPTTGNIRPSYDKATGQLQRLEYDSDGDGKIDTWGYMDGARVVRVEIDEDGDGKVDRWEYHGAPSPEAAGAGPDKTITRIERATRHDGRISRWEYFDGGSLARVEEDTDGDGKVDKWETYGNGTLLTMALDSKRQGIPDRRLVYRPDGSLDRIEVDPTGSGHFQPLAK
jgi:hypothetical protein